MNDINICLFLQSKHKGSDKDKDKSEKTEKKQTNGASDDLFPDEDEENEKLMALAMSFEAKYVSEHCHVKMIALFY